MNELFRKFSQSTSEIVGGAWVFLAALGITLVWLVTGPFFHFSDTWQLFISTVSSAVTFLMVFLIQNAQNRDTKALNLKLDALVKAIKEAPNDVIGIENAPSDKLEKRKKSLTKDQQSN
jgi:low affinity Fe/Cu permease